MLSSSIVDESAIPTLVLTIPNCYALTTYMTTDEPRNGGPKCFCLLRTYPYQIPTRTRDNRVKYVRKFPTSLGSECVIQSDDNCHMG
jgi:hypothetical protein